MPPEPRDAAAIWDILDCARNVREFIAGLDEHQFVLDKRTHFAVIAQIEIIGEAAKRLSTTFRQEHDRVPWRQITGMRDFLIHAYDQVDLARVWHTAVTDVPELAAYLRPSLPPCEDMAPNDQHS